MSQSSKVSLTAFLFLLSGQAFASDFTGMPTLFGIYVFMFLSPLFGISAFLIGMFFDPETATKKPPFWFFVLLSILAVPSLLFGMYIMVDALHLLQKQNGSGFAFGFIGLYLLFVAFYAFHIYVFFKHKKINLTTQSR